MLLSRKGKGGSHPQRSWTIRRVNTGLPQPATIRVRKKLPLYFEHTEGAGLLWHANLCPS